MTKTNDTKQLQLWGKTLPELLRKTADWIETHPKFEVDVVHIQLEDDQSCPWWVDMFGKEITDE